MITGEALSKMSLEEVLSLYNIIKSPTQEQKEKAWKKMDTGIYDSYGNLIGDTLEDEDRYEE